MNVPAGTAKKCCTIAARLSAENLPFFNKIQSPGKN